MFPDRHKIRIFKILAFSLLLIGWGFFAGVQWQSRAEPANPPERSPLRVGFTRSMFSDMNVNDARAAIKVWADSLAKTKNLDVVTDAMVYEDFSALQHAIDKSEIDLASLRIDEYLDLNLKQIPETIFSGSTEGSPTDRPLLVTQRSISSLSSLQNKRLNILIDAYVGMSKAWLNSLLLESGLPEIHQFSADIKEVNKTSQAVLPVFFGQRDACVVAKQGFEVMIELNPQIKEKLSVLMTGPEIVSGIMFLCPGYNPPFKEDLVKALEDLHLDPKGQQVLMLFKINRLVHCQDGHIIQAREIMEKYRALKRVDLG